ncbi:MAG: PKD domain-containing protein [Flavobacteriales bacterium]|nr:PKD domain-containing protein [Flavobacteriales bacterium]
MHTPVIRILFVLPALWALSMVPAAAQALFNPGGASYVNIGDLDVAGTQITVEALVMSVGPSVNIVSKHTGPGNVNYLLRPGGVEITTSNGYIAAPANFSPQPNVCYHVAFTYDGATVRYYVNGCLASSVAHSGTLVTNNLATAIGNQSNCQCEAWNGYIDEVRIWNVARAEADIQANMFDLPNPTVQAGLQAYYKFNGDYTNAQGNAAWNGTPIGSPQLLANATCDNADFTHTASATVTDVSCPGGSNGTATLSSAGGAPDYYYSVDGVNYGPANTVNNLPAGNATVFARSGIGSCIVNVPVTITEPAAIAVNIVGTDPTCYGYTNGTAALTVSGGTSPYSFLWSNGSTLQNPTNLSAGNSSVTITDANGCTASGSIDLTEPPQVVPQASGTFVSNVGVCDATGTSTPFGGTPPYTYLWGNGATTSTATALCEGPNTLTVTDALGCTGQQVLNISVPVCLTDVDFNTWQQAGAPANGNWVVQLAGAQVRQTINGNPTFFLTPVDYINVRLKGRMRTTNGDDDFIGVVFGHKLPLGNSTFYDTYLFDWKQVNQNSNGFLGQEGFALNRIVGNIPNTAAALGPTFWGHTNTAEFTVLATDYGPGKGYVRNQFHDIEVLYTTTRAVIIVDSDTIFDIPGCYEPGRFGFYNYSQPDVYYSDFTYELFTNFNLESQRVCTGDSARMVFYEPCGAFNILSQFDELQWDFGDGTGLVVNGLTSSNANPAHLYQNAGNYTVRLIALDALGCRDTVYRDIQILPLPQPNFTVTDRCHQDLTQFADATVIGGSAVNTWIWDLGDGAVSAVASPQHTYTLSGIYNVNLAVTDADGCSNAATLPVEIYALPDPMFASVSVCNGEPMDMIDVSQDPNGISTTDWQLGDGTTASTPLVSHLYPAAGTYNVTLEVTSGVGCTDQVTQQVMVFPNPVADLTFSEVCAGQVTQLNDASTVGAPSMIDTWMWDIGNNGITDYQTQNAQHTFGLGGTYNVTLTVATDFGCEHAVTVAVISDPNPVASASATEACLGLPNDFTDLSAIASGTVTGWDWDFGDGNTSTAQHPQHTYAAFGTYNVTLTVTSDLGCTDITAVNAMVHELPVPSFAPINACHAANFPFANTSTIGAGSIAGWAWDFGDGGTSAAQNPTHTYPAFGTYDVQLTATSAEGCIDSISQSITLHDNPQAGFEVPPVCQMEPVQLLDTSIIGEGSIVAWNWTFAGGGTSAVQNPTHAFLTSSNVNVTLTVTSDFGCTGTTTRPVTVFPKPAAAFSAPDVCLNEETVITDQSTVASGTIDLFEWELSDGTTETLPDFNHLFVSPGIYDITLMVETDQGCRDTIIQQTEVHQLPDADFTFSDVCLETEAMFTDGSTANSGTLNLWQWDFGDGEDATGQGPQPHSYPVADDYDVTLIVGTTVGCSDTLIQTLTIHPMPVADFTADSVCFGVATQFTNLSTVTTGSITSNVWEFGGGQGNETPAPSFLFPSNGYTNVTLTVSTALGCFADTMKAIRVYVLPEPEFTAFDTCAGKQITFTNLSIISEGAIASNDWTMGDGNLYTSTSPTHMYADGDFYTVRLVTTSNYGCVDSTSLVVEVYPLPVPSFTPEPNEGCVPLPVSPNNTSTIASGYSLAGYEWRFGNGSTAGVPNPTTTYTDEGSYDITLIATSAKGCVDSLTITDAVTAWPKPVADFVTDTLRYHMRFPKPRITEMSQGATVWHWDFGDGTEYEEQVPTHVYEEHGTYDIIQTVFNDFGCSDTFGIRVIVDPNLTFFIPSSFTPNGDGLNDGFFGTGEGIEDYEMWIYNRWGQLIFYSKNKDRHWEGRFNGNDVQVGVYSYKFIIKDITNRTKVYSGEVTIYR